MTDDRPTLTAGARWDGADVVLTVRVVPRASADSVTPEAECLRVRLTAPPVEGKANAHLGKLLGKLFEVPKSRVIVDRGAASRHKLVRIVAPAVVPAIVRA